MNAPATDVLIGGCAPKWPDNDVFDWDAIRPPCGLVQRKILQADSRWTAQQYEREAAEAACAAIAEEPPPPERNTSEVQPDNQAEGRETSTPLANVPSCDADRVADRDVLTPATVVREWQTGPPPFHLATEIKALDDLCRGGMPFPRRVVAVGAPGACKTGLAVHIADEFDKAEVCVGFLAIDEEPEDITLRLLQMADCDREKLEARDPEELAEALKEMTKANIRFYGPGDTIEHAAADLAAWAKSQGKRAALFVDSIQTATCKALHGRSHTSPRDVVEANVAALRRAASDHGMFTFATSEANRASYKEGAAATNQMAAGAESRAIEFSAQTLLVMVADEKDPTVFHVNVVKNRALDRGEFSLKLTPKHHVIVPVDRDALKAKRAEEKRAKSSEAKAERAVADAATVARVLVKSPGLTVRKLYVALRKAEGKFSEGRANNALAWLGAGLVKVPGANNSKQLYLHGKHIPHEVLQEVPEAKDLRPPESE